jgi:hypothetical protein
MASSFRSFSVGAFHPKDAPAGHAPTATRKPMGGAAFARAAACG